MIRIMALVFLVGFSINAYAQNPFPCDDRFYQVFGVNGELSAYDLEADEFEFAPFNGGTLLNAGGRNPVDGYAYFISTLANDLIRMASNGSTVNLGPVAGLPLNDYSGGDFWSDGLLYVNPASNGGIYRTFYGINVATQSVERVIDIAGDLFAVPDIAYNIQDNLMYAVTSEVGVSEVPEGTLLAINLQNGTYEIIGATGVPAGAGIASMFADGSGNVYGANRFEDALLYQFNLITAEATPVGRSVFVGMFDGPIDGFYCATNPGPLPSPNIVPTLSEWGLIAMAGLLGIFGLMVIRRKKAVA